MDESPLRLLVPLQGGALWIGAIVAVVVLADFRRVLAPRNLALAGLLALAPLFVNVVHAEGARATRTFEAIYVLTALLAAWGLRLGLRGSRLDARPNLPRGGLAALAAIVVACNAVTALGLPPDDAGYYTNLGAQRWRETGLLPYADLSLKGPDAPGYGAAATYGPMLYAAHLPAQAVLGPPGNPPDARPMDKEGYRRPPVLATQATCLALHLLALGALFAAARRLAGTDTALAIVLLHASSPYVTGLGGERSVIGGLAYVSHIAPSAVTLLAFALRAYPFACGALLAVAAGMLYYPAFFLPLWLGWFLWGEGGSRRGAVRFAAGFAAAGAAIAALVLRFTPPEGDKGAVALFLESTLEHQEGVGPRQYGSSTLSFWGTHPGLAQVFHRPLVGSHSLFKPTFLAFAALSAAGFLLARRRSAAQLAGLTAMLAAAVQLWKTHAAGSYVEWYYPFLLLALFAGGAPPAEPARPSTPVTSPS